MQQILPHPEWRLQNSKQYEKNDKIIRRCSETFKLKIQRDKLNVTLFEIAEFAASDKNNSAWEKTFKKNFVNDHNWNQAIA